MRALMLAGRSQDVNQLSQCSSVDQADPKAANLPALRDPKVIIQRYLSDESTKDIAASYGITRQALGQYLLKNAESEWKDAQVARAIARKEQAEDDLEAITAETIKAADKEERERLALGISLAREKLKSAQWDLERVCRRIYGQDAPTAVQAVQVVINLRRSNGENADVSQEDIQPKPLTE